MGLGRDIRIDPAVSRLHSTHCESKPGQSDRYEPTKKGFVLLPGVRIST